MSELGLSDFPIEALDKSVTEATDQRKEESEEHTALMASDASAKELLKFAMNRLNKFYNPALYLRYQSMEPIAKEIIGKL